MKKILFVVNTLGRAGAELSLLSLLRKLNGKGYELSLRADESGGDDQRSTLLCPDKEYWIQFSIRIVEGRQIRADKSSAEGFFQKRRVCQETQDYGKKFHTYAEDRKDSDR